jgi:hypothetical protein
MTTATKQKFKVTFYKESDKLSPVAQKTYGEPISHKGCILLPIGKPHTISSIGLQHAISDGFAKGREKFPESGSEAKEASSIYYTISGVDERDGRVFRTRAYFIF